MRDAWGVRAWCVVLGITAAVTAAACSVDSVTFLQPSEENCEVAGDEDGNGAADCEDAACRATCQLTCGDGQQNGNESDVDCGGVCAPCEVGRACAASRDCAGPGVCDALRCRMATSCAEILQGHAGAPDGVYPLLLDPTGRISPAVCDMSRDGGGWTLLLKANGDETLAYFAVYWVMEDLLNEDDLTTQPGNAKYPSFVALGLRALRGELDGFRFSLELPAARVGETAQQIFTDSREPIRQTPYPTFNTGAPNWSAQPLCRYFGANPSVEGVLVRFGWSAGQDPQCGNSGTAIGLGVSSYGAGYRCDDDDACDAGVSSAGGDGLLWGR